MKTVALVDDHPVLMTSIAASLHIEGVAEATPIPPDDENAAQQLIALAPDLCLLDLDLGYAMSAGMRFVRLAADAGLRVAMFTGSKNEIALGRCIEAGAVGVISKSVSLAEVIAKVRLLLAGEPCSSDTDMLRWVLAAQRFGAEQRRMLRPFVSLSDREEVVLEHLIDGLRVDDIAHAEFVSVATVRSQVQAVLRKLGVNSQLAAVAAARRAGWGSESLSTPGQA